ncbi:MAG: EAL domain-containing protein [Rudaea sp.]
MTMILVVDDRAINREFLATLFVYSGYEVVQAADGIQALEMTRERHPDLVITDVLMPRMDGVEFADRLRQDPDLAHTPVIFYTATFRLHEAKILAETCHVVAVIAKPAEPQEILDVVSKTLGTTPATALPHALPPTNAHQRKNGASLPGYLRKLITERKRWRNADARKVDSARASAGTKGPLPGEQSFHVLTLQLAALLEFDLTLGLERDPQRMVELLCRAASDILHSRYAAVAILDSEGNALHHWAAQGFDEEIRVQFASIDPRAGIFADVITSGQPCLLHDPQRVLPLGLPGFHPPISSLLAVPIAMHSVSAIQGWLYVADKRDGQPFVREDEQLATTISAQFALTFGNFTLYDEVQQHAVKLEIEVQQRRRAQEELAYRINHDQTTGLPRFALIENYLQIDFVEASAQGGRVMVFYLDIDRFHTINETRGRKVGDEVLRTVAARLTAMIGSRGHLAHVAADEFVFTLRDSSSAQDQVEFGETIRALIEEPMDLEHQRVYVTCSIGVGCFPDNGVSPLELLRQAEAAMRQAKNEGRNAVVAFANEQKLALEERQSTGMRLRDAIHDHQFVLQYQPQISGRDWQILGFEALVRWQSPEFGLLLPARFLGIAEELGLIIEIDSFVLESACRQVREWLDAGAQDFCISVNVSTMQLQRPEFVAEVRAVLDRYNVPARCIELELTEHMMVGNVHRVIATMRALKILGVKIALDDFGTGYSSLNYLRQFPIDTLKIDQSFVQDISSDSSAAGICRAIINLGHQLGMTALAEGVETAAQVGYLRQNECDNFQGFYFSKAVTAEQAFVMLKHRYMEHAGLSQRQDIRTLLLVDDEENILSAVNRVLRRDGYRIFTANSAEEAFDILARNEVEVILSDQRMPGVSGTEFLSKVKDMYPRTVRIMLSGYTDLNAVTEAINRGSIYKFLIKPWDDEDLRAQIRAAFRVYAAGGAENPQLLHRSVAAEK